MIASQAQRRGLTLVELLVVIAIISILTAIALPTVRNTLRDQKVPRSVNLVKAQFERARSDAIRSGRPHGVVVRRAGPLDGISRAHGFELSMCASQPSYSGDALNAETILQVDISTNPETYYLFFKGDDSPSLLRAARIYEELAADNSVNFSPPGAVVGVGDVVTLAGGVGGGGELRIGSLNIGGGGNGPAPSPATAAFLGGVNEYVYAEIKGTIFNPQTNDREIEANIRSRLFARAGNPLGFRIYRSPRKSLDDPSTLIDGTTIDFTYSGLGTSGAQFSPLAIVGDTSSGSAALAPLAGGADEELGDFEEVWIIFSPDGTLQRVYYGNTTGVAADPVALDFQLVNDSVYLLVGYVEGVFPSGPFSTAVDNDGELPNIFRGDVAWVTLMAGSGQVNVAPINTDDGNLDPADANNDTRLDPVPLGTWQGWNEAQRQTWYRNAIVAAREGILLEPAGEL